MDHSADGVKGKGEVWEDIPPFLGIDVRTVLIARYADAWEREVSVAMAGDASTSLGMTNYDHFVMPSEVEASLPS